MPEDFTARAGNDPIPSGVKPWLGMRDTLSYSYDQQQYTHAAGGTTYSCTLVIDTVSGMLLDAYLINQTQGPGEEFGPSVRIRNRPAWNLTTPSHLAINLVDSIANRCLYSVSYYKYQATYAGYGGSDREEIGPHLPTDKGSIIKVDVTLLE
ncbi:MAG: hypothetical protein SGJ05_06020 [bacterium]|nr:hypothetical protein [bacterium]